MAGGAADSADGENTQNTRGHCRRNCFIALDGIAVYWEVCLLPAAGNTLLLENITIERKRLFENYVANLMHVRKLGNKYFDFLIFNTMIVHPFYKWYNKNLRICDMN